MTLSESAMIISTIKSAYPASFRGADENKIVDTAKEWALRFANIPVKYVEMAVKRLIEKSTFAPTIAEVKQELVGMVWDNRLWLSAHYHETYPLPEEELKEREELERVLGNISPIIH